MLLAQAQLDFRKAEPRLQTWVELHPQDRDFLLALAEGYSQGGNSARAQALIESLLARDPHDGGALCLRARRRMQQKQISQALADLETALSAAPNAVYAPNARLMQAICLLDLGRFEEALQLFQQCRAEDPDNPKAIYGVGRCARFLNRPEEAEEAFQAVLHLRPDHLESLLQVAYLQEEQSKLAEALATLREAEKLDPYWYEVPFRMAKILTALGQGDEAGRYQKKYVAMRERWLKRQPGQTVEEIFHLPEEPAFPSNLLP
jgi:tetratricopeptide (TPR) repeat protein